MHTLSINAENDKRPNQLQNLFLYQPDHLNHLTNYQKCKHCTVVTSRLKYPIPFIWLIITHTAEWYHQNRTPSITYQCLQFNENRGRLHAESTLTPTFLRCRLTGNEFKCRKIIAIFGNTLGNHLL